MILDRPTSRNYRRVDSITIKVSVPSGLDLDGLSYDLGTATTRYDALSLDQKLERYRSALSISKHSQYRLS